MGNETWPVHNLATAVVESMRRHKRKPADVYPTPADVTQALLDALQLRPSRILEPACGDGQISRVLALAGHEVISSDLRRTGYGTPYVDFLSEDTVIPEGIEVVWTNPPFGQAQEFIERALQVAPMVCMLLKSNYWHTGRALPLYHVHPPSIEYKLTWRPAFLQKERGDNPLMDCSWLVWRGRMGTPTWRLLRRPKEFPVLEPELLPSMVKLEDAIDDLLEAMSGAA